MLPRIWRGCYYNPSAFCVTWQHYPSFILLNTHQEQQRLRQLDCAWYTAWSANKCHRSTYCLTLRYNVGPWVATRHSMSSDVVWSTVQSALQALCIKMHDAEAWYLYTAHVSWRLALYSLWCTFLLCFLTKSHMPLCACLWTQNVMMLMTQRIVRILCWHTLTTVPPTDRPNTHPSKHHTTDTCFAAMLLLYDEKQGWMCNSTNPIHNDSQCTVYFVWLLEVYWIWPRVWGRFYTDVSSTLCKPCYHTMQLQHVMLSRQSDYHTLCPHRA
jgi:hypothetical protein